jgi:signal transduction histidine kinase
MQVAAKRMQMLIQDLLAYSRTNTSERNFEKTNLNTLLTEVESDLSEEILQNNARLDISKLPTIDVISFQLKQLFNNLISNSLKFTNPNSVPQITVLGSIAKGDELSELLVAKKKYCHITFADQGIGFDSRYSERIFEVFQQLNGKGNFPGTGIGLAIVKRIVDNHNGLILASGKIGEGAKFDIYLPVSQPQKH